MIAGQDLYCGDGTANTVDSDWVVTATCCAHPGLVSWYCMKGGRRVETSSVASALGGVSRVSSDPYMVIID